MIYVLGGNGFVGSAYARLMAARGLPHRIITRENYDSLRGTACDIFINANGNSRKFLAAREPLNEFDQSVRSVAQTLEDFRCGTYVFLSTGDVYPDQSLPKLTREDQSIDPARQSRYGLHKSLGEQLVRGTQQKWLILRMGGFVGLGLEKNAIHDMLTGATVWLSPQSELQFISTDRAAQLVWGLIERDVRNEIVNLGAQGTVHLGALHKKIGSEAQFAPDAPTIRFELSLEKLAHLGAQTLPTSQTEVEDFGGAKDRALKMGKKRALILDRDGVINVDHGYVHRPQDCEFVDGIFEMVQAFVQRGFLVVIATNQAGIGRGLYTEEDFQSFMGWMRDEFHKRGIEIAAVYHCPDHPTAGVGAYRRENDWRKPGPGMFLQAARDLDLDLAQSWCVGDKISDMEAARAAGIGIRVLYDTDTDTAGDIRRVGSLMELKDLLAQDAYDRA